MRLKDAKIGCYTGNLFVGVLAYADDITHLALISLINSNIEDIIFHNPNLIVVFAGDLNGLDTTFLIIDCGLFQVNDAATHGPHILDKFFISRPGLCTFKTVLSSINARHKAVVISDLSVPTRIR